MVLEGSRDLHAMVVRVSVHAVVRHVLECNERGDRDA